MNAPRSFMTLAAALGVHACAGAPSRPTPAPEVSPEQLSGHPVRHLHFWRDFGRTPLEERVRPIPDAVLQYVHLDNAYNGFDERPTAAPLAPDFVEDLRAALRGLPREVRAFAETRLAGIHVVRELGGTAYTEWILDHEGRRVAAFCVFDAGVLERSANAWATWKESTAFTADARHRVRVTIEPPERDVRLNAIRFILLHELAHVILPFHPAFAGLSWRLEGESPVSRFDAEFAERPRLRFYGDETARLPAREAAGVYAKLARTSFPTLYAATSPYDDFAETFALFVHTVLDRRPYRVEVLDGDAVVATLESCFGEERCREKAAFVTAVLQAAPATRPR